MNKKSNAIIISLLLFITVFSSLPLFSESIFSAPVMSHDTFYHTQRIWSIKTALAEGQFPVRIYSELYNGYGYGASLFYPDLFLYFPALLCLTGIPLASSYNIFLIIVNLFATCIAYYSYSRITKSQTIGLIASSLYVLSTYRLVDLYTRGAMGELLALTFCPLVLCGFTMLKRGEHNKWWILTLAYTGLVQSHILTFIMLTAIGFLFVLFHWKNIFTKKGIFCILKAAVLWLAMNVWFLLPFLQEMQVHSIWGNATFWRTKASFVQLFDMLLLSVNGTEPFGGAVTDSIPKTPGFLLIIGIILLFFALLLYKEEIEKIERRKCSIFLLLGAFFTILITDIFPWEILQGIPGLRGFLPKFQFIWRFNVLGILFLSLAAAYGFYYFFIQNAADTRKAMVLICIGISIFSTVYINQFVKQATQYDNDAVVQNGYTDMLYLVPGFEYLADEIVGSNANVQVSNATFDYGTFSCTIEYSANNASNNDVYIDVPLSYYSGYQAYINNKPFDTYSSDKGLVRVYLPTGENELQLYVVYEESLPSKIANIISLFSWILFFAHTVVTSKSRKCLPSNCDK